MELNMINKYNNTVIQSKGGEHGKRVIEWWKEQGVDLDTYSGCSIGYYYGLIDSVFGYWRTLPANITIIELPESKPQDLIGRNVRGFKFDSGTDGVYWCDIMQKYVGKIGPIIATEDTHFLVNFGDNEFYYPASLIHDHLVDEVPSGIIDLTNVEGVEMMVSDDEENWFTRKIIAKRNDAVIDSILTKWYFFRPIEVKKVTMREVEQLFGCKVDIVKED